MAATSNRRASSDYYITSVAAELVPCSVPTLRNYVKQGLINPERTIGEGVAAVALFTDHDIGRARELMAKNRARQTR